MGYNTGNDNKNPAVLNTVAAVPNLNSEDQGPDYTEDDQNMGKKNGGKVDRMADGGVSGDDKKPAPKINPSKDDVKKYLEYSSYIDNARNILDGDLRKRLKLGSDADIPESAILKPEEVNSILKDTPYTDYYKAVNWMSDYYSKYGVTPYDKSGNPIKTVSGSEEAGALIPDTAYGPRHRAIRYSKLSEGKADGGLTSGKAKKMLKDNSAYGKPLTDQQKKYFGYIAGGGKSEGGEILGPGTSKSDSIAAKVEPGSFIVPAENAGMAEVIRKKYFGDKDAKANTQQGSGRRVNLSTGEHMFTPEEYVLLKR